MLLVSLLLLRDGRVGESLVSGPGPARGLQGACPILSRAEILQKTARNGPKSPENGPKIAGNGPNMANFELY